MVWCGVVWCGLLLDEEVELRGGVALGLGLNDDVAVLPNHSKPLSLVFHLQTETQHMQFKRMKASE